MFAETMRAYNETIRCGSIRKAAARLGVAPSSISRQITLFERQMGTRLIERHARGVHLTHAGTLVAQFVHATLFEFDALRADLDDARGLQQR